MESYSHLALAEIEAMGTRVEFGFIDGWHTFDHALTDFFHVDRVLSVGGVVVFDDFFSQAFIRRTATSLQNRAYRIVGCTEQPTDYKPSKAVRVIRQTGRISSCVRKLLKAKFLIPDETLGFTPDCRCVAFEKVSDDNRGWADHFEFLCLAVATVSLGEKKTKGVYGPIYLLRSLALFQVGYFFAEGCLDFPLRCTSCRTVSYRGCV